MIRFNAGRVMAALFVCIALFIPGCLQAGKQAAPAEEAGGLSSKTSSFSMGGVSLKIAQPQGYVEAPQAIRQAVSQSFTPPENIFAVYIPASDKAVGRESGKKLLRDRKIIVVSSRPEFNREIVDPSFYRAMQRDIARVNGKYSSEWLAKFKVLTQSYYARDDAFSHSLGVYDRTNASISVARILRQGDSREAGATSAYRSAAQTTAEGHKTVMESWAESYFARAYHQVSVQNVLFLNGRCFNIYFFAPLAGDDDVRAALRENKNYIEALTGSLPQLNAAPNGFGPGGQNSTAARTGTPKRAR